MSNFEKLQKLLEELFQLDQADLDFGIYRIMNQKRDEVVRFLEKDLLPQVKEAFSHYKSADKATLQTELDKAIEQANGLGVDPESTTKVKELREQMADSSVDVTALENEVFSHLFNFFRRYYHEGDFISLRRYKEGVYAIPYEGEEVKLHWANHDQYYVKSSEWLRNYSFQCSVFSVQQAGSELKTENRKLKTRRRVSFRVVSGSTEQDNKKEQAGKERQFILCEHDPVIEENGELVIRFEYRLHDGKEKQDALNAAAVERILSLLKTANRKLKTAVNADWHQGISSFAPTAKNKERTLLAKHLSAFTARNTFDYFIHKDLGGFLRRELDFYIKNEVMHLDDIEHDTVPRVEQYLSKIKVIRKIAHKVIQFLEQLENFQKRLWLKKKFVVETNYCITLDRVPEELYPEITANDAQREEWVRLFAIDEIEKDLNQPGYSEPLSVDFLKSYSFLTVDSAHFGRSFVQRLLSAIEDLESACDGVVFDCDNFHFLSLTSRTLQSNIDCIFIDPPYNTGSEVFMYKDSYQHSSWASMMYDRLRMSRSLLSKNSAVFQTIDDVEYHRLRELSDLAFGEGNFVANMVWQKRYVSNNTAKFISDMHDYVLMFTGHIDSLQVSLEDRTPDQLKAYKNPDDDPRGRWRAQDLSASKPYSAGLFEIVTPTGMEVKPPPGRYWRCSKPEYERLLADNRITFGVSGEGRPMLKAFLSEAQQGVVPNTWWSRNSVGDNKEAKLHLKAMFYPEPPFSTPKPVRLVQRCINLIDASNCLDFFAGSGTTGEAVIDLVRTDGKKRKFFLCELGGYTYASLIPRLKKAAFASKWKEGQPANEEGCSLLWKYVRLESYEDTLGNLEVKRTDQQVSLLEQDDDLREQYVLSYMLEVESRGSQSLLNVESFRNPDEYKLRVERNGETQLVNVDLVETFNWLLGLTVKHIDVIRGVCVVEGTNPDGDRALVLWRNLDEIDNDALDEWFKKQDYNTKDQEYDLIYVNGDNNLENLRRGDQTWKVRLIEEEFGRLMFDVEDV